MKVKKAMNGGGPDMSQVLRTLYIVGVYTLYTHRGSAMKVFRLYTVDVCTL